VNGKEKAWSNSLRAMRESGRRHDHVLEALRKLMKELPVSIAGPNFRPSSYVGKNGKTLEMIEFSEDVLGCVSPVCTSTMRVQRRSRLR
jgi:hypothetical protein